MSHSDGNNIAVAVTEELLEFCESDLLSEEGLRKIIERHGHGLTHGDNNNTLSNYEFFCVACLNERITEGIIRLLLEYFPDAARSTGGDGWSPLHIACFNKSVTRGITKILIDAGPDSVRSVDNHGRVPLHWLCANEEANETTLEEISELLIEKYPEAVRHACKRGELPIHMAAIAKSPVFCQVLIEGHPGSERMTNARGLLPFHNACWSNTADTVEFLHKLYPDAIKHTKTNGLYPIHSAMRRTSDRNKSHHGVVEIVQYLLDCDSNVKFQKYRGMSLLQCACMLTRHPNYNDSNTIVAALDVVKAIYDVHPEAIEGKKIEKSFQRYHKQVQAFINSELVYARQAKDPSLITTPDDNRRLPLHTALQNNVRLGSIKLLVKGNPHAVLSPDNSGALPLHIACEHHDFASVRYLVGLDTSTLEVTDRESNTALHYACRGARHETVALLLDEFGAVSVSKQNADGKLPIDLLWESNADRESIEYTESVYRLLKAYPEMIMGVDVKSQ